MMHHNETINTEITKIEYKQEKNSTSTTTFDYLINAAGFLNGKVDDMLKLPRKRLVKCTLQNNNWPEIIFPGERGTHTSPLSKWLPTDSWYDKRYHTL